MAVYRLKCMPMPFYWDSCSAQQKFSFRTGFSPILNITPSFRFKLTRPKRCMKH